MAENSYRQMLETFISYCRTRNLSINTIRYYDRHVKHAAKFLEEKYPGITPEATNVHQLREYIAEETGRVSTCTVNHHITCLKAFFNFLGREEEMLVMNPVDRLDKAKAPKRLIKTFSNDQIQALLRVTNHYRFAGARDHAILILMLDTGLRITEVTQLTFDDIDFDGASVRVIGKGDKERVVPMGRTTIRRLREYLERRGDVPETNRVFVNEYGDPVSSRTIQHSMMRYGQRAKITGVRVSPHTCRHTFAKNWILNGGDPFSLQQILGHTTMDMVKQYVALANEEVKQAHKIYSPMDRMFHEEKEEKVDLRLKRRKLR